MSWELRLDGESQRRDVWVLVKDVMIIGAGIIAIYHKNIGLDYTPLSGCK